MVDTSLTPLKHKWDNDLDMILTDTEWRRVLEFPRKSTRNPKLKFIQLMITHRAYLTPSRLHSMYPEASDECPRSHVPNAKLFHMLWSCPRIKNYWLEIYNMLHGIAPLDGDDSPGHYILGVGAR